MPAPSKSSYALAPLAHSPLCAENLPPDEAMRLGFFHEVVEPDTWGATAPVMRSASHRLQYGLRDVEGALRRRHETIEERTTVLTKATCRHMERPAIGGLKTP